MISDFMIYLLIGEYVVIAAVCGWDGRLWMAVYWLAAAVLNLAVARGMR
jgi:hypothetical protein